MLSHVRLFVTPWIATRQTSLSITNSWSSPKVMSNKLVMPSNHLILCCPLLLLPSIFPSTGVFSNESALLISGQSIGISASTSTLPVNTQDWSPLGLTGWISGIIINNSCLLLLLIQVKSLSHVWLFVTPLTPCQSPSQAPPSWDFPGKNTGVDFHFLLHGIFLTQGLNPGLPHCRQTLYHLSNHGSSQLIQWTWKIGIIISIIILQKSIQRLRKVKWLMTYLNPQSSQIGRFQSYLCTSEAYTKHDMRQSL